MLVQIADTAEYVRRALERDPKSVCPSSITRGTVLDGQEEVLAIVADISAKPDSGDIGPCVR